MTAHVDPRRPVEQQLGEDRSLPGGEDETLTAPAADREATAARSELIELGPYLVLKQLGQGGMGTVYLARDTRLNRKLALKVMLPNFAAIPASRERFLREARAAAQISHDNVVTVYEADERDGIPYIAMQYLQGYPLDEYLKKKGNPSIPQVLRIARETVAGLAAAHRLGLVHRDIKPGNLWLEAPGGRIKVLDFGLAKPVKADVELTQHGAVIGTPAYMSPEQARGNRVDARSDLFSLGAVLYRLVTGRLPFRGDTSMAVLMALASEEPLPVRAINPDVPEAFAELIHKLLAKDPSRRLPTADDVAKVLREISNPPVERAAALPVATRVQVVYVPIEVSAEQSESPFEDLEETATAEVEAAPLKRSSSKISRPRPRPRSRPWPWIAAGLIGLVALAAGAIVIIITNKDGTKTTVEVPDGSKVEIKDNGNTVARVGPKMDDEEKKNTPSAKGNVESDSDRKTAEWVLTRKNAEVNLRVNGLTERWTSGKPLPVERFELESAGVVDRAVGDDDMTRFAGLPKLTGLTLHNCNVSDAGLAKLRDLPALGYLNLQRTKVTDAGLPGLHAFPALSKLVLSENPVTDAGLKNLHALTGLKELVVLTTKVTAKGLADFHAAVPGCKITHDGGTIEPVDIDRKAAEWVLSRGGRVAVDFREVSKAADLPNGRLVLTGVLITSKPDFSNDDLAPIAGCKSLQNLDLSTSPASDATLVHFAGLTALRDLKLYATNVSDAGLTHLARCTELDYLNLGQSKVTDAGMTHLVALPKLSRLGLSDTGLTDVGLEKLRKCTGLRQLHVRTTKVTAKGLADFHAAVPGCKITHDGGTIEAIDPDRKAAEWVLSVGGTVKIDGRDRVIASAKDLPKDRWKLTDVDLSGKKIADADLAVLGNVVGLQNLLLDGTSITDAGLVHVSKIGGLKSLFLDNCKITDAGLDHLQPIAGLQRLWLGGTGVTNEGMAKLKTFKSLNYLGLRWTKVGDPGLVPLKDMKELAVLFLSGIGVTDDGMVHLKELKKLTHLTVDGTKLTDAGLARLRESTTLRQLDVSNTKITKAAVEQFHLAVPDCWIVRDGETTPAGLSERQAAEWVLSIGGSVFANDVERPIKAIGDLPKSDLKITKVLLDRTGALDADLVRLERCKNLKQLNVSFTKITGTGLAKLVHLQSITHLIFYNGTPTDAGLEQVGKFLELQYSMIGGQAVTDKGLEHLKNLKKMRFLEFYNTRVTDAGLEHLAGMKELTHLTFAGAPITDAGLKHLRGLSKITDFRLNATEVTDKGLAELHDMPELKYFNMAFSKITDAGLAHLKKYEKLAAIDIGANPGVTDAGLKPLAEIGALVEVGLSKTRVTSKGLAAFREAKPKVKIIHDGVFDAKK